jgi:alkanesulfonate monooxygenase SsuD/methylene tetrahydromethanopterin reductase-like flavin-dependent oxidoreductase (luciferase family)
MNLPVMVPGLDRDLILDWCRRIDAGPYSSLAAGERITFPNPEIMVTVSAAAAITTRVRLALTVIVLPMHPTLLMAKQIATLDVISGGRVSLGVGVGAREEDYRALDRPFTPGRLAHMERQVALMRRAWAGEHVVEGALRPVEPLPLQPGGPEILAGSLTPTSIRRAARWADGLCGFSFGPSLAEVAASFDAARAAWKEAGRTTAPRLVTSCWFALGPDATGQIDRYLARYLQFLGPDMPGVIAPTVRTTSATALTELLEALEDLGTDELLLVPTTSDPDEVDRVANIVSAR